jgi:puromycin-sensitive aminopeptidase
VVHVRATAVGRNLQLRLRQERFFADQAAAGGHTQQLWPVPIVLKHGNANVLGEERVLLDSVEKEVTLNNAQWFFPNGGASGFYRFTMDDTALAALAMNLQKVLAAHERLSLVDNQWALLRAGHVRLEQYLLLLAAFGSEPDRAVIAMIADQLSWLALHVVTDETRPDFEKLVEQFYRPQWERLGWDPKPEESADERMTRAAVIGALGGIARALDVRQAARQRFEAYAQDRRSLDPNLASVVVGLAARDGDAALYDRFLELKRAASRDPEEEQRFLLSLAAFEDPQLIQRTLDMGLSDAVRSQDRTFLLNGLLGRRAARETAWRFVRSHWPEIVRLLDPMLLQGLLRGLGQLTFEPLASEVCDFIAAHVSEETRETVAQVTEQLRTDSAAVTRLQKEIGPALRQRLH